MLRKRLLYLTTSHIQQRLNICQFSSLGSKNAVNSKKLLPAQDKVSSDKIIPSVKVHLSHFSLDSENKNKKVTGTNDLPLPSDTEVKSEDEVNEGLPYDEEVVVSFSATTLFAKMKKAITQAKDPLRESLLAFKF